jgi:hydrogenase nickel incorporation protein HypA/HybF
MHELSIAMSLLDLAAEEAERLGNVEVCAIRLRLGPLSGVVKEALLSAYELAREGSPLAAAELVIDDVRLAAHCPTCGVDREPASVLDLRCPICGTPTPTIVRGRELEVVALEIAT